MATAEVVTAQSAFSDQETSKAHESTNQQTPPVPQSPQEAEKETQVHNKEQEEPPVKDQGAATEHSEAKKEEEVIKPVKEERHEEEVKEKEVFDDDQSNPTDHHQIAEADTVADKLQEVKTTTMTAATVDTHDKAEKEIKQEEVINSSSKVAPEPTDVVEVIPVAEDEKNTQEKGDVAATATDGSEENKVEEAADHENKAKENEKDKEVKAEEKVVDAEKIKPDE